MGFKNSNMNFLLDFLFTVRILEFHNHVMPTLIMLQKSVLKLIQISFKYINPFHLFNSKHKPKALRKSIKLIFFENMIIL